jgi:diguanylate cyclase (GGDEF)-like protein/PAS domain S-box-containing protein
MAPWRGCAPPDLSAGTAVTLRQARWAYLAALAVFVTGYFVALPLWPVAVAGVGVASVAAIGFGLNRIRPRRWSGWLLIALAVSLFTIGEVIYTTIAVARPGPMPYPFLPDVFYLAMYLPLAVGLLCLGRPPVPSRDWPVLLDTAILALAGSLITWIALIRPALVDLELSGLETFTAIANWIGYIAVLASAIRILLVWRGNRGLGLVGAGVVAFLIADFLYGSELLRGTEANQGPEDLGYMAFCALCGAGALTPSIARLSSAQYARHRLGPVRLALLATGLLAPPTALLAQATTGGVHTGVAIAIVSALITLLLLARLSLSVAAYRSRLRGEHAVREALGALVAATTASEVITSLEPALSVLLPPGAPSGIRLLDRPHVGGPKLSRLRDPTGMETRGREMGEFAVRIDTAAPPAGSEQWQPAESTHRVLAFVAPVADLVEAAPAMSILGEQAGSALGRIDLVGRLRAEERERYFRTLVLTSTHATLISRNGRIDYATPATREVLGRDVRGLLFDDLVRRDPPVHRGNRPGNGAKPPWRDVETGVEGYVRHADGSTLTMLVHRRDLTDDPTVNGVVTTLRDITAEREAQRDLAYRASHDHLTGLANAQHFRDELRRAAASKHRGLAAAVFVDLDDFKAVNDTYGHEIGDGLLVAVAQRIQSSLREQDLAARLGGDEFAALLRDVPDAQAAQAIAERISAGLTTPANVAGIAFACNGSVGLALARTQEEYDTLLRRADAALYAAKADGKGLWRQYRPGMTNPLRRRADRRAAIEAAIRENALAMRYQPIVELATGAAIGFEACIHPSVPIEGDGGPGRPVEIMQIAEETGLAIQLGDWAIAEALAGAARLNTGRSAQPTFVCLSVSARQLRHPGFTEQLHNGLASSGIDPSLFVVEVGEDVLVREDEEVWTQLAELRRIRVRVMVDFGTGHTALDCLRRPAIDLVKFGASFLHDIDSGRTRTLLDCLITVTGRLSMDQIADGVQNRHTHAVLRGMGCRFGQGAHYGAAIPIDDAARWGHGHAHAGAVAGGQ